MKHRKLLIALSLVLGFFLLNCTGDDNNEPSIQAPVSIHFSASPYRLDTKAIHRGSTMPTDQAIGIYGWGHKVSESSPLVARQDLTNQAYTTEDGTNYISNVDAHFPVAADTVIDFYAYYPYQASLSGTKATYDLKDQIDIMWATPLLNKGKMDVQTDSNNSSAIVDLSFNHQLSAISVIIRKADDIKETLSLQKVELLQYSPSIVMDIQTGALSTSGTIADYLLPTSPQTITSNATTVLSDYLLWPGEAPTFRFTISDHIYQVKPTQAFMTGKQQKYVFTIQAEDINVSAAINPWTDGPDGSGEIGI